MTSSLRIPRKQTMAHCGEAPVALSRQMLLALSLTLPLSACAGRSSVEEAVAPQANELPAMRSLAVYALSRGKGVPEATRAAFENARSLLETASRERKLVRMKQERIGLEGEQRLCAEYANAEEADKMFNQMRTLAAAVELLNVVREPCAER